MQKQKGISTFIGITIIVVAIVIFFGGVFAYQYFTTQKANNQSFVASAPQDLRTAGWKTYTNTEYGFEIKYPDIYAFKEYSNQSGYLFMVNFSETGEGELRLGIRTYDEPSSVDVWINQNGFSGWSKDNNYRFKNQRAVFLTNKSEVGARSVVLVSYGGKLFRLDNGDNKNFDNFISTFKFTK